MKKGLTITAEQARAHQERHGFGLEQFVAKGQAAQAAANRILRERGKMNRTEAEFARILEAEKQRGQLSRFEYEGVTLRWAGMRYTPDFVVMPPEPRPIPTKPKGMGEADWTRLQELRWLEILDRVDDEMPTERRFWRMTLIEVKGAHIWDRDKVRFKGARHYWPEFSFEMWQKKAGQWKRLE